MGFIDWFEMFYGVLIQGMNIHDIVSEVLYCNIEQRN